MLETKAMPCGHTILDDNCRVCWLSVNDARYARLFGTELLAGPVFPCVHLGNATKEFIECPSCPKSNLQMIPLHKCAIHGKCAPSLSDNSQVHGCGRCAQKETPKPVLQTVRIQIPDQPAAFNPSIIDYQGRLLFCYRSRWAGSTLWICELDRRTLQPLNKGVQLHIRHPRCRSGQEDPRLFLFRDRLHVQFSGVESRYGKTVVNLMLVILTDDLTVQHVWEPILESRQFWEKNWEPFDYDRELFFIYHPFKSGAHHVLKHDNGVVTPVESVKWTPKWNGGEIRGGASPVRVGDEYWCFFHGYPRYSAGLYTFDAKPPFRPRRMLQSPLLIPNTNPGKPVIFPCGAVKDGDRWFLAFGRNDQHTEIAVLDHNVLEKLLVRVHAPMNLPNDPAAAELRHQDSFGEIFIPDDQHAPPIYREVCVEDTYGLRELHGGGLKVKTAIDLGASYGVASRMIHGLWPEARVIAFEPDRLRFKYLERNCPSVEKRMIAVVGFAGQDRMLAGIGYDGGKWRKDPSESLNDSQLFSRIKSVSESLAGVKKIDLLKIDVEGFELGIIQEMREMGLLADIQVIVGEWHFQNSLDGLAAELQETHDFVFDAADDNPWNRFRATKRESQNPR